jgi:hypothetical protein
MVDVLMGVAIVGGMLTMLLAFDTAPVRWFDRVDALAIPTVVGGVSAADAGQAPTGRVVGRGCCRLWQRRGRVTGDQPVRADVTNSPRADSCGCRACGVSCGGHALSCWQKGRGDGGAGSHGQCGWP